jgi:hypothetical protein
MTRCITRIVADQERVGRSTALESWLLGTQARLSLATACGSTLDRLTRAPEPR